MNLAILGSGMAGFGAGHRFHSEGLSSVIYEMRSYYGGHTSSHTFDGGWVFDEGPHISFTKVDRIKELFAQSVESDFREFSTIVNNHWKGHWIKHPAQCNLYGLPAELVTRILLDFVKAQQSDAPEIRNYADWLVASFGRTFAETFPMEYGLKYHTTPAENMTTDWIGPRLYQADLEEVLRGALSPTTPDVHYIEGFRYPTRGGFVAYLGGFLGESELRLNHRVTRLDPVERVLTFEDGATEGFDHVVSSIPLPELIPMIVGVPPDVRESAERLACTTAVIVNIGVDRADLVDAHWTYFYDSDVLFSRLSTPYLQSPNNVPPGCGSLQAECYFSSKYRPLVGAPEDCIEQVIDDLRRCGILREDDSILFTNAMLVPYANVIFDHDRATALATVHAYLDEIGVQYCGRYGEWAYIWTDESFMSGENAAQRIIDGSRV